MRDKLKTDEFNNLLCPGCETPLEASVVEKHYRIRGTVVRKDGEYLNGHLDLDLDDAHHSETALVSLSCPCCGWGWAPSPAIPWLDVEFPEWMMETP
jgi:hypothetical protein